MDKHSVKPHSASWFLLFFPTMAWANAGLPMLIFIMPLFALSIIPVVAIEAIYLSKKLKLAGFRATKVTLIANLASTLMGIPLTWCALVIIELIFAPGTFNIETLWGKILSVTLQAPWLVPHESELRWMIPAAGFFLLIPFFFASWWSEYWVSKKMLKEYAEQDIKYAVRNANLITYSLLSLAPPALLYWFHFGTQKMS